METYCINRTDRKDRWETVKKTLKNEKWKVKRFNAIIDKEAPFFWCTLSHRGIIEIAMRRNLDYVCVLEDDIILNKNGILKEINHILKTAPHDWHILYLGWALSREAKIKKVQRGFYRIEWVGDAHALIYSRRSYKNLLTYLPDGKESGSKIMWFKFFDHFLWFFYQKKYPCYANGFLIDQKSGFSDIQGKVRKRKFWFERLKFNFYKNCFWRNIFIIIGKLFDYLNLSNRALGKKGWFWLDYVKVDEIW